MGVHMFLFGSRKTVINYVLKEWICCSAMLLNEVHTVSLAKLLYLLPQLRNVEQKSKCSERY